MGGHAGGAACQGVRAHVFWPLRDDGKRDCSVWLGTHGPRSEHTSSRSGVAQRATDEVTVEDAEVEAQLGWMVSPHSLCVAAPT
jgi:hypothetical protein